MSVTPKASWGWVKAMLHSVYDQPDAEAVHAQFNRVVDAGRQALSHGLAPRGSRHRHPRLHPLPKPVWLQQPLRAAQPRDPPPHRRRRHLPRPWLDHPARRCRLAKQHDESAEGRRYLGPEVLAKSRAALISTENTDTEQENPTPAALTA